MEKASSMHAKKDSSKTVQARVTGFLVIYPSLLAVENGSHSEGPGENSKGSRATAEVNSSVNFAVSISRIARLSLAETLNGVNDLGLLHDAEETAINLGSDARRLELVGERNVACGQDAYVVVRQTFPDFGETCRCDAIGPGFICDLLV